jgi:hypothetical protein
MQVYDDLEDAMTVVWDDVTPAQVLRAILRRSMTGLGRRRCAGGPAGNPGVDEGVFGSSYKI